MRAGWKNRIDERRYFEEKKAAAAQDAIRKKAEQDKLDILKEWNALQRWAQHGQIIEPPTDWV